MLYFFFQPRSSFNTLLSRLSLLFFCLQIFSVFFLGLGYFFIYSSGIKKPLFITVRNLNLILDLVFFWAFGFYHIFYFWYPLFSPPTLLLDFLVRLIFNFSSFFFSLFDLTFQPYLGLNKFLFQGVLLCRKKIDLITTCVQNFLLEFWGRLIL